MDTIICELCGAEVARKSYYHKYCDACKGRGKVITRRERYAEKVGESYRPQKRTAEAMGVQYMQHAPRETKRYEGKPEDLNLKGCRRFADELVKLYVWQYMEAIRKENHRKMRWWEDYFRSDDFIILCDMDPEKIISKAKYYAKKIVNPDRRVLIGPERP